MKYKIIDIDDTICHTPQGISLDEFQVLDHSRLPQNQDVIDKIWLYDPHNIYETIFLTSRCQSLYFPTRMWLEKYAKELFNDRFHLFMRPIGRIDEAADLKLEIIYALGLTSNNIEVWIDDDKNTIKKASTHGFRITHPNTFLGGIF